MQAVTASVADEKIIARAMHYLNAFRLIVAPVLIGVAFSPLIDTIPPGYKLFLVQAAALTYLGAAIVFLTVHLRQTVRPSELAAFSIASDLILIGIILHCFGGMESGLALLLLFSVGISGLLLPLRIALLFASLIAIGLMMDTWLVTGGRFVGTPAVQAALFGIAAFGIALGSALMGRWGRKYQLLAERRGNDLANLERVNELIIHRMRSGVVVVDERNQIRQMNESARYLLGSPPLNERDLKKIAPPVFERLQNWRRSGQTPEEGLLLQATQVAVVPRMMDMPGLSSPATLIFLEDTSVVSRRARDLAQASLARLSASIAHEIRNPLGALSHAAQLLGESEDLPTQDQKLVRIILNHTARMNDIVESVLKLSRRERAHIEATNLTSWMRRVTDEFRAYHKLEESQMRLELPSAALIVMMDPGQMTQAVWNLLENSLKHGRTGERPPVITVRISPIRGHREVALDIIDDGPGIPLEKRTQVFEPFFTTHNQGSGLGLYLARQLCDASQAPLEYVQIPRAGACFRILLRRPESGTVPTEGASFSTDLDRETP